MDIAKKTQRTHNQFVIPSPVIKHYHSMVPHLRLHPLLSVSMVSDVSGECLRWAQEWMTVSRWVINHNKLYHCFCSLSNLYYTVPLSYHFHTAIMPWLPGCISECSIYGIYFKIYPKHDPNTGTYIIQYGLCHYYWRDSSRFPQRSPAEATSFDKTGKIARSWVVVARWKLIRFGENDGMNYDKLWCPTEKNTIVHS